MSALAAACGGSSDAPTERVEPAVGRKLETQLERRFPQLIGSRFGCVARPRIAGPLTVYVTDPSAREQARALLRDMGAEESASVRVTEKAQSGVIRHALLRRLRATAPAGVSANFESDRRDGCPRIELMIPTKGPDADQARAFAARAELRYGADRVLVREANLVG